MIAAGLDGLHAVQPCCRGMDLARLKSTYGGADSLQRRDRFPPRTHQGHARKRSPADPRVLAIMAPGGGYMAGASHDYILEETPVENVVAMFDAVTEFGTYGVIQLDQAS